MMKLITSVILSVCILVPFVVARNKPNIIFIIGDDLGWNDVGFLGSEVPTPNIDALAYNGIILNRHYALPSCSPSRASLLTAKYPCRIGMQGRPIPVSFPIGLSLQEKIMPQYFKDLGYDTHLIGKWHLGYYTPAHLPTNRGFDTFFGFLNGFLGYYDGVHFDNNLSGLDAWRNTTKVWHEFFGKYLTNLVSDEAVKVIEKHAADGKDDGLFMIVASPAPHRGNRAIYLEPSPFSYGKRTSNITDKNRRIFADIMKGLDDTVGDVTSSLKKHNMIDNSIIIFLADNGAPSTDDLWHFENFGSNWPLKGEKLSIHEGGVRTAAAVWSPWFVSSRSTVRHGYFHISDWLPTLYTAAGGNITDLKHIDGINQWDSLISDHDLNVRKELLVELDDVEKIEAVIKNKWKLLRNRGSDNNAAFSDGYYGTNRRESVEYNKTEIITSKVGLSISTSVLNDTMINRLRTEATIFDICSTKQKEDSMANDCHTKYCLYDIQDDPGECIDVAGSNKKLVQELGMILDKYRKIMVKKPNVTLDKNGLPGESNYWQPWVNGGAGNLLVSEMFAATYVLFSVYFVIFQ